MVDFIKILKFVLILFTVKKNQKIIFFSGTVDPKRITITEKMSPAITVNGERGTAEGPGVAICEGVAEVAIVTVTFSGGVETGAGVIVGDVPAGAATLMTLLSISFIDGLLALTKYWPGCISPRNS